MQTKRWNSLINRYVAAFRFFITLTAVLVIVLILPKGGRFKYEFDKGKLWMHNDLVSPFNYPILKSEAELKKEKEEVLGSVVPIYTWDRRVLPIAQEAFKNDFLLQWKSKDPQEKYLKEALANANFLLVSIYKKGVIILNGAYQKSSYDYNLQLVENNLATYTNTSDLFTPQRAVIFVQSKLARVGLPNKELIVTLIKNHLSANIVLDEYLTHKVEQEALSNLSEIRGMVQKGELVVAKGNIVDDLIFQKLESLKKDYDKTYVSGSWYVVALSQFLLVGMSVTLMMAFLWLFRKDIYSDNRKISLILLVFVFMLGVLSWAISIGLPSLYYIPYCSVPVIITLLFDSRIALNIHLLVVMIAGFFVPNGFEFVFLQVTSGMVAIYSIRNLIRRSQFLISAVMILLSYLITYIGISMIHQGDFTAINWQGFIPFIVSVVLSLLAYPLIYVFEKLFDITSEISLMELTNTNNSILRDLAFRAPGTFQHSMQVANLAEAATYKIGGNPLLIRAGALYHDIGKMRAPEYFKENQNKEGFNPHDKLSFEESAKIIIKHVTDGVEIARKANLPAIIIDFIRTHHGNTRVEYFYRSYLNNYPQQEMNEKDFKYPGPIPFSKETAVLMLADSVEAASRSLKEPDAQSISALVDKIIDYKQEQKQLINSDISLKDIDTIRRIFKDMLMGIYHVRMEYGLVVG